MVVPPAQVPGADAVLQAERWRLHAFPVHHEGTALVGLVAVDVTDDAGLELADPQPAVQSADVLHVADDTPAAARRATP